VGGGGGGGANLRLNKYSLKGGEIVRDEAGGRRKSRVREGNYKTDCQRHNNV
jgi:hypothetical protein